MTDRAGEQPRVGVVDGGERAALLQRIGASRPGLPSPTPRPMSSPRPSPAARVPRRRDQLCDRTPDLPVGELPDGVSLRTTARGTADVIVSFHDRRAELARRMPRLRELMEPAAGLWIAWPKRSSGVDTDLTEDLVRELALANRLVDNKVCAIDETWSGLRLVIRLRDR